MRSRATASLFLLIATVYGFEPKAVPTRFEFSQVHMGTRFNIVLYASEGKTAARASDAAFERIARLDATMSDYRETSELMRLCRAKPGRWVKVSRDLMRVLSQSQQMAERSDGAFDITAGPLVRLWRRARRTGEMPSRERLAQALALTGYKNLRLDKKTRSVRLGKPGMLLDLGGIAKGFAADEAMAVLKRHGVRSALVAAGGDIVVSSPPPGSRGWTIAVAPIQPGEPPARYLSLRDTAVSTSGEREQYVEIDGVRYSHIIDPRTGLGIIGSTSVTVVAPNGATSDAIATAVSVLGPERGLKLADRSDGVSALFVQASGQDVRVFESKRWKYIPKTKPKTVE